MATPASSAQNKPVSPAQSGSAMPSQGAVAAVPNQLVQAKAASAGTPPVQTQPSTQKQATSQPTPQANSIKNPKKNINKFFMKPDWLFFVACAIAVLHVILLVSLENEKNEYNELKKEDADRVYILQKASSVTQEDLNTLELAFLDEKKVISFIQTLETSRPIFDEFTLAFTSDEPQGKDLYYLPFSVTAVGGRGTLLSFINKLLSSTYVIEAVNISMEENDEDPTKTTMIFVGNLYIQNGK